MITTRFLLAACSVALFAAVVFTAAHHAPANAHVWLLLCGIVAVATALHSAAWDPGDLTAALLLSLPPLVLLLSDGAPTWLAGPLAALLLVAAELNALSWELQGAPPVGPALWRRLRDIATLGALGLAAAFAVGVVAAAPLPAGVAAAVLAGAAIAALGRLAFGREG